MKQYKHLFGPVSSRRLGKSLGVDLVPHKTCSLNCVYCECGLTTKLTMDTDDYISKVKVLEELDELLSTNPELDYITFSGSGEPTLHSGILEIAHFIKTKYPRYKICLLTNSSMLTDAQFFDDITTQYANHIDLIVPSYDAVSEEAFEKINQPVKGLTNQMITEALIRFSHIYNGILWLEVFIVPGVNDTVKELELFCQTISEMKIDKVQLNCLDRPAPYDWVETADSELMNRVKVAFEKTGLPVEIIGKVKNKHARIFNRDQISTIVELISRRPGTVEDIANAIHADNAEVEKLLAEVKKEYQLLTEEMPRGTFYRVKVNS